MICPKCGKSDLRVTHTYKTPAGQVQRSVCSSCRVVLSVQSVIVAVDPRYGQGAAAIARRMIKAALPGRLEKP